MLPSAKSSFLDQLDKWEKCVAHDSRLARLVPLEEAPGELTLSVAAGAAALQENSFSRYFHQAVGVRFRDWKTALKVARALELLESTSLEVDQIALKAGFQDSRSLRRAANRFLGASPSVLRARQDWFRRTKNR